MEAGLEHDENRLRELSVDLADQIAGLLVGWLISAAFRLAEANGRTLRDDETAQLRDAAEATAARLAPGVRHVLTADVDAGLGSPLAVIRTGTGPFTSELVELGFAAVARDEFARRHFPEDLYDLGPASFADIDPTLHEPGLEWGAARAHVHLRRRREAEAEERR